MKNTQGFYSVFESPLARKILLRMLFFGTLLIVLISIFQLKHDYDKSIQNIYLELDEVKTSFVKPISAGVWSTNRHELELLLESITWQTKIDYAAVIENNETIASSGKIMSEDYIERNYPLSYTQDGVTYDLGSLVVIGSLDKVYAEYRKNINGVLIFWISTVFVLGAIFFLVFHNTITLQLLSIADYIRNIDFTKDISSLSFNNTKKDKPDEFDLLVNSINEMAAANINARESERALRTQLMQSQKMESIGMLSGGIAHDFNNMLGIIQGYTELLEQTCASGKFQPQTTKKYLGEIITACHRAKDLVSQILLFSRQNTEVRPDNAPVVLIEPIIGEVEKLLHSSIPTSITIVSDIRDKNLKTRIHPVYLHQIILNLAINARDAMGEYGKITIVLERTQAKGLCSSCYQSVHGDYIALRISDTGSGITKDQLSRIFDPFYTTKEVGKGTGMGLSVVHGIAHSLHGHIEVQSEPNKGTTISILLPEYIADAAAALPEQHLQYVPGKELSGKQVLVVDDEKAITSLIKELLQHYGADVVTHTNPCNALETFTNTPDKFDLVITDETMPELSGMDLARTMRQLRPDVPIILCTGYSEHISEQSALQQGISCFFSKPIDIKSFVETICSLLSGPPPQQAAV